ncbi:hypothetical protein [Paraburkholderia sediminicola]|uniref:hypothetical protein n=1 Tax=Paraburkholderia sediminicola TaxID=458836 RepID=UPI0038B85206
MTDEWHRKAAVLASAKPSATIKDILMPLQPIPLVAVEPDVSVPRWKIFEPDEGFTHLVGSDALRTGGVFSYRSIQACTSPVTIFGPCDVIY